jgi:hypothetical protein
MCHYAECHVLFIILLNVVMLSVVKLSVIMLSVVMLSVVMLSVIMLSVIMQHTECCYANCRGTIKSNITLGTSLLNVEQKNIPRATKRICNTQHNDIQHKGHAA